MGTLIVAELLGDGFAWVSTLSVTLILLIFGEIAPKIIAKAMADKAVYYYAFPMKILNTVFLPLNKVVVFVVSLISKIWTNKKTDKDDDALSVFLFYLFFIASL